ncbi:MAG: CPBP family intramembrane metalloprotease [Oscillospiraceae bacterium]|nr:CPBP family intramembrane metalloprotease [Oscillospiraceae bacterium]
MKQIAKCVLWVLLNFVMQFIVQLGMTICAVAGGIRDDALLNEWTMNNVLLMTLISNTIFTGIMCIAFAVKKTKVIPESDSTAGIKSCLLPCAAAFLYSVGFSMLSEGNSGMIQNSVGYFSEKLPWLGMVMMVINLLILAPIAEELLCRRIMLDGLKQRFSERTSVIVSAVIFGAMHIMAGGPALALGAAVMGLLLGVVYVKTGSLRATVIVHAAANLPDFLLMWLPELGTVSSAAIAVVALAAALAIMLIWCRTKK